MNKRQRKKQQKRQLEKELQQTFGLSNKQVKQRIKKVYSTRNISRGTVAPSYGSLEYYSDLLRSIERQYQNLVQRFIDYQIDLQYSNKVKAIKRKYEDKKLVAIDYTAKMNELGYRFKEGELTVVPDLGTAERVFNRFVDRYTEYVGESRGRGLERMMNDYFGGVDMLPDYITEYYINNQTNDLDLLGNITDFMKEKVKNNVKDYEDNAQTYLDSTSRYD